MENALVMLWILSVSHLCYTIYATEKLANRNTESEATKTDLVIEARFNDSLMESVNNLTQMELELRGILNLGSHDSIVDAVRNLKLRCEMTSEAFMRQELADHEAISRKIQNED